MNARAPEALTYASLFAGAGGADLGLEQAGLRPVVQVERDPHCVATQILRGSRVILQCDVGELDRIVAFMREQHDGPVYLGWASPPCQGFSPAGKRLGRLDPRDGWAVTEAWIHRVLPRWILIENSARLLDHNKGCPARSGSLPLFAPDPTCGACYVAEWRASLERAYRHAGSFVVDTADYGLPQNRRRAIVWGGPAPLKLPRPTHGPGGRHPHIGWGEALGWTAASTAGWQVDNGRPTSVQRPRSPDKPAPTVSTAGNMVFRAIADRPAPTVTTSEVKGTRASSTTGWTYNGGPDRLSDAMAMATGYAVPRGSSRRGGPGEGRRRRATVVEAAVIQGFAPRFRFCGNKREQYKQVGNAVPPMLSRLLATAAMRSDPTVAAMTVPGMAPVRWGAR